MSRQSQLGNSVVAAAMQVCALMHVPCWRMNSRVVNVATPNDRRGFRPMAMGSWIDSTGKEHTAGMADLLAQPNIRFILAEAGSKSPFIAVTVPLWIECKAGKGQLSSDQRDFREYVLEIGAHYLLLRDCADELFAWFKEHGVKR